MKMVAADTAGNFYFFEQQQDETYKLVREWQYRDMLFNPYEDSTDEFQ